MTTSRTLVLLIATLSTGVLVGLLIGLGMMYLSTARASIECGAATEDLLRAASASLSRGQCEAVQRELNATLSGPQIVTYDPTEFSDLIRAAASRLNQTSVP